MMSSPKFFIGDQSVDPRFRGDDIKQSIFLKACRLEKTSRTPVWLLRQAGRYMPEYRAIREKTPFLQICKNPDLVAEITVHAQETLGVDAAIIFSDILLLTEPLGFSLDYLKGDGPSIKKTVRTTEDVENIKEADPAVSMSYLYEAIRKTRQALKPDIPLIGFAGGPFTLTSYLIEGGSSDDFARVKTFMKKDLGRWNAFLEKITRATIKLLNAQIEAGVQAVQIFDSWVGCLEPEDYETYVLPHSKKLISELSKKTPVIHFGVKTGKLLEKMAEAGGDVIGVDHRIGLSDAWGKIGPKKAIQGNLDPEILCRGSLKEIEKEVKRILKEAGKRPGHIFNLGHGVLPETPVENAIFAVKTVKELGS